MATKKSFSVKSGLDANANSISNLGASNSSLAFIGGHSVVLTTGGATTLTLPTTGTLLYSGGALGTPTSGNLANCTFPTLNQNTTGSAATLTTPRAINGVNFDGSAAITVTAAAGTLTGATLNSSVTGSSLTSLGTIGTGVWQGSAIADTYLSTISTAGKVSNSATTATSANTASAIVARDASGNFIAGSITTNGRLQNAGGLKTYSVSTVSQGNVNAVHEIMKVSRDNLNWSNNTPYEITVYSSYYQSGGCTKWLLSYGWGDAGSLITTYAGGSGQLRVYLGTEVTISANLQYRPVFIDLPPYMQASVEVRYSTTEVASAGAINASGQVFFTNVTTASGGTGNGFNGSVTLGNITSITTGAAATAGTITGDWSLGSGSKLRATYADLAENYTSDQNYDYGTVLMIGGEKEVTIADEDTQRLAGVVSQNPAYLMNSACEGEYVVAIALQGRTPVRVKGKVNKGDFLVSAGDGYAKATDNPRIGSIIGKSLESFNGEYGMVEVMVGRL